MKKSVLIRQSIPVLTTLGGSTLAQGLTEELNAMEQEAQETENELRALRAKEKRRQESAESNPGLYTETLMDTTPGDCFQMLAYGHKLYMRVWLGGGMYLQSESGSINEIHDNEDSTYLSILEMATGKMFFMSRDKPIRRVTFG